MNVDKFYEMIKEQGPIELSQAQKTRIRKLFVNLKDQTIPYSMALKNLIYSGENN